MLKYLINTLDRINNFMSRICNICATTLLMLMLIIVVAHIFSRYLLSYSFSWTEESARYMMVWVAFLLFPTGHKKGLNVNVEFAVAWLMERKIGIVLRLILEVFIIILLFYCIKLSSDMIQRGAHTYSLALRMPMSWVYYVLPISFILTALCSVENILRLLSKLFSSTSLSNNADQIDSAKI